MRIAIITESFAPDLNGVANCVLRVAEHLVRRGHEPLVIAPESSNPRAVGPFPYPVKRVPSVALPGYTSFRLGLPSPVIRSALISHGTDLVHLASPVFLGVTGSAVARRLDLPTVAVYQTDIPSYARAYGLHGIGEAAAWRWLRHVHNAAERSLAPSTAIMTQLRAHGFERIWLWSRGVDTTRFDPAKRSAGLRQELAPGGEVLAGYVGRLATEKRVDLLAPIAELPGVRLVIVGGGPAEAALRERMPSAVFLGEQRGEELARTYASLDVFVHSGPYETFGQTLQEAAASGLPVVAPAAGGPLDIVDDGGTGHLVAPGSVVALADAVARLAADAGLRAAQGRAARQKMLTRSWSAIGDKLISHYAAVLRPGLRPAQSAGAAA
ncbi:MAG TPA: glycosyltransferase family 1 protein [Streptosporangiaceae bacterium]|nr:glycosyltransferase family 1 protein [Streptosporangiaceae bacterium]